MGIYRLGVLEGRQMPGDGDDKDHMFRLDYVSKAAASCLNMNTLHASDFINSDNGLSDNERHWKCDDHGNDREGQRGST